MDFYGKLMISNFIGINIEKYLDEKKFNEKILKICEKIEKIEGSFNEENNNFKNNDEMSPNLKTINLSDEMISSYNNVNGCKNHKILFECIHKWNKYKLLGSFYSKRVDFYLFFTKELIKLLIFLFFVYVPKIYTYITYILKIEFKDNYYNLNIILFKIFNNF